MQNTISSVEEAWDFCLTQIRSKISAQSFNTWFKPIIPIRATDNQLTIQVPSQFFYEWIDEHFRDIIDQALYETFGKPTKLKYSIVLDENANAASPDESIKNKRHSLFYNNNGTHLNSRYIFDNFVEGDSNQFAKAASLAVAESPGKTSFNPLLIYGGVGLGKTHLIQAIGNHVLTKYPNKRIQYVSSEKFTLEFINAIKNNRASEFSLHYRNVDILLVDDVQFFINKERTQEEFFHTFNELQQKGKQIVLSSDRPPQELAGLEDRLISRFSSGLIADIQPPDLETRIAILQRKAEQDRIELSDEITQFIAANISSNIRELEGALIKLLAYASLNGEDITLRLAKRVLKDLIKKKKKTNLSIELIQRVVSDYFSIKEDLIRAKTRKKEIVEARQISMYLAKSLTNSSLKTIGLHFGGRDHTTVIHACQTIENRMTSEPKFRDIVQKIQEKVELETQ